MSSQELSDEIVRMLNFLFPIKPKLEEDDDFDDEDESTAEKVSAQ